MRGALAALVLAVCAAQAQTAAPIPDGLHDLTAGQYELKVSGLLCWACARAIAVELSALEGVEHAKANFDRQAIEVSVKSGAVVASAQIRRALKRAEKLANLGGRYRVDSVDYRIAPIVSPATNKARL